VPRAGDEPVDDAAFAERAILVCAEVRERPDLVAIAEHRDTFTIRSHDDAGTFVRDRVGLTDNDPAVRSVRRLPLAPRRRDMQRGNQCE